MRWAMVPLVLLMAGCAGVRDEQRAQASPELRRDVDECSSGSGQVRRSFGALAFTEMADKYARFEFNRCMRVRGWRSTSSDPARYGDGAILHFAGMLFEIVTLH